MCLLFLLFLYVVQSWNIIIFQMGISVTYVLMVLIYVIAAKKFYKVGFGLFFIWFLIIPDLQKFCFLCLDFCWLLWFFYCFILKKLYTADYKTLFCFHFIYDELFNLCVFAFVVFNFFTTNNFPCTVLVIVAIVLVV